MSLQSVLAEIKRVKPFAEEDVNSGPIETLNGRRGRKAQSIEQLKRLKREYQQNLIQNTVFIISTGSQRKEFEEQGVKNFGLFAADPEQFYSDLAKRVAPALYLGKEGVSNIFDVLGRHLEDKMMELDINEYNQLIFKAEYAKQINSVEQFTQLVKLAINKQIGAEIAGIQAITSLVDVAIERDHADKITPVVLSTGDEQFAQDLLRDLERLTTRVFLAVSGDAPASLRNTEGALVIEEANKTSVGNALKTMKKNLKK